MTDFKKKFPVGCPNGIVLALLVYLNINIINKCDASLHKIPDRIITQDEHTDGKPLKIDLVKSTMDDEHGNYLLNGILETKDDVKNVTHKEIMEHTANTMKEGIPDDNINSNVDIAETIKNEKDIMLQLHTAIHMKEGINDDKINSDSNIAKSIKNEKDIMEHTANHSMKEDITIPDESLYSNGNIVEDIANKEKHSLVIKHSANQMKIKSRSILLDTLDSMVDDLLRLNVFGFSLETFLENTKKKEFLKVENNENSSFFWKLVKAGLIMATKDPKDSKGRGKKDHKGSMVLSALVSLGVMVPVVFSAVALMAKKALISSLVALGISIYALTQNKGAVHVKQKYEVEGPVSPPGKHGELKFNSPQSDNVDYPIPNISNEPYSFPYDDTKYFNTRPSKTEEDEERNEQRTKTKNTRAQNEYNRHPKESNQYEVTERNDMVKTRRPGRPEKRPVYDQENYNTNTITEAFKPIHYHSEIENRYRHDSEGHPNTQYDERRHGKERHYQDRDMRKHINQYYENTKTSNPIYENNPVFEKYPKQMQTHDKDNVDCYQNKPDDERHFKNKHYSSKYITQSPDYEISITTEYLQGIETPPTEQHATENNNNGYNDNMNSENEFKPMIMTPFSKYNKTVSKHNEDFPKESYKIDRPYTLKPYYTIGDNRQYQDVSSQEFQRPNPVYKPEVNETEEESGSSGVTLSYVIRSSNANVSIKSIN